MVLASLLLFNASCEAFFGSFVGPHPDNCVSLPEACNADEVCNAETRRCEPRIDCRNTPSICTSQQICNAQSGACEAKPLPPRLPSPSAICLGPGLCWENPFPVGNDLYGVGGTGANDVWVVGNLGTAMHYDGNKWAGTLPGGPQDLRGVWSASPNDVWAAGNGGAILHWTGTTWQPVASATTVNLRSIWGSGPKDIWAVGLNGTIL